MNEQQRLMERAWQLQDQAEKVQEEQVKDRAMRDAASELGLDPVYLEQARAELAREAALREGSRRVMRRRLGIAGAVAVGVIGLGLAGWQALQPPPPQVDDFTGGQSRWSLDVNPGTQAQVRWEQDGSQGEVAVIDVDRFAPDAEGRFKANLDQVGERDLSDYKTISFKVRGGGLPVVRVYLETPNARWRSPAVSVGPAWGEPHTFPLSSFEYQTRQGGGWKVADWEAPGVVQRISFKVGHFMNGPEASGEIALDDLELE